jgi:cytochrome P450
MSSLHSASALCVLGGLALAWRLYRERTNRPSWLPLPPGPKGYPLIDNLLDFPTYKPWLEYTEWNKLYGVSSFSFTDPTHGLFADDYAGDVVYFKVLGQPFLIVGSAETAFDLFDKRSSNYSDRPRLPMINEMYVLTISIPQLAIDLNCPSTRMAWTFSPAMLPYGSWWRRHRRLFHDYFHPNIVHRYNPILLEATRAFLREFLRAPDGFVSNIQQ